MVDLEHGDVSQLGHPPGTGVEASTENDKLRRVMFTDRLVDIRGTIVIPDLRTISYAIHSAA